MLRSLRRTQLAPVERLPRPSWTVRRLVMSDGGCRITGACRSGSGSIGITGSSNNIKSRCWQVVRNSSSSSGNGSVGGSSSSSKGRQWIADHRTTIDRMAQNEIMRDAQGRPFTVRPNSILPLSVVEHPIIKAVRPFVGNGAYLALATGFLMTDILALRVLLVGGYSGLVLFHTLHTRPLRIPLFWSAVFVAVNVFAVMRLVMERYPMGLTEEDALVHETFFSRLSPAQFLQVLQLSQRQTYRDGERLTTEKEICPKLYFVERGTTKLTYRGEEVCIIGRGGFINDVGFQQGPGSSAYGTVECVGEVSVIVWDADNLRSAFKTNEKLGKDMQHIITSTLVDQLLQRYKLGEEAAAKALEANGGVPRSRTQRLRESYSGVAFRHSLEEARNRSRMLADSMDTDGAPPKHVLPGPAATPQRAAK